MGDLIQSFKNRFGYKPPGSLRVPAPIEWLGFRPAAFEGLSLGVALDRYVKVAMAPRRDGRIAVVGGQADQWASFGTGDYFKEASAPWLDPLKGVLFHLHKRSVAIGGFDMAMDADPGAESEEVTRSACLLACALAVRWLYPYALGPRGLAVPPARNAQGTLPPPGKSEVIELARFCAMASTQSLGCDADPGEFAIALLAREFQTVSVDWHDHAMAWHSLAGDYEVLVLTLSQSLFPVRMEELESGVRSGCGKLQIRSPRSVEVSLVRANHGRLSESERAVLAFLATENQRVTYAEKALLEGDVLQFAQYLRCSHQELIALARPDPSVILALDAVDRHPGVLGGRLVSMAGNWVYAVLIARHAQREILERICQKKEVQAALSAKPMACRIAGAADLGT